MVSIKTPCRLQTPEVLWSHSFLSWRHQAKSEWAVLKINELTCWPMNKIVPCWVWVTLVLSRIDQLYNTYQAKRRERRKRMKNEGHFPCIQKMAEWGVKTRKRPPWDGAVIKIYLMSIISVFEACLTVDIWSCLWQGRIVCGGECEWRILWAYSGGHDTMLGQQSGTWRLGTQSHRFSNIHRTQDLKEAVAANEVLEMGIFFVLCEEISVFLLDPAFKVIPTSAPLLVCLA